MHIQRPIYFEARVVHGGCARGGVVVAGGGGGGIHWYTSFPTYADMQARKLLNCYTTAQVRTTIEPIIIIVGQLPST